MSPEVVTSGPAKFSNCSCRLSRLLVQLLGHLEDLFGVVLRGEGVARAVEPGEVAALGRAVDHLERPAAVERLAVPDGRHLLVVVEAEAVELAVEAPRLER